MKRIIFVVAFLCLISLRLQAQQADTTNFCLFPIHKSCIGGIISHEHLQLNRHFTVDVACYFLDTTTIEGVTWELPEGWIITQTSGSATEYYKGDSMRFSFSLSLPDMDNLPFYPQHIEMTLLTNGQDGNFQKMVMAGKVYFTPYNTIEVWSLEDFYNLKRHWLPEETIAPQRMYVSLANIPQSNLEDDPTIYERDSATCFYYINKR